MQEQDPSGISNKFRIYRSNSPGPPLSLREANYSIKFPPELNDTVEGNQFTDILRMLDEYFGEANYTNNSSAHDLNQTASDLNKSIRLLVVGTGEDAEANLVFSSSGNPTLQITNGGRGFLKVPTFKILEEDNKTEFLTIDRSWIRELSPNDRLQARLFDNNLTDRWIRGVRINADNLENGPKGLDVSQVLNRYYLFLSNGYLLKRLGFVGI
jgi:hypothetical protein